jgi:phosphatidylethanolamine/phosphatidyl-N-methylethanolamine N-methyltransferase
MFDHPPSRPDARIEFLRGFLREPQQVGSIIPSSRFLEKRVVSLAGVSQAQTVVELGPGTGGTTRAILKSLPRSASLLAIEIDPRFVSLLRRNSDPRLLVHNGSAADLLETLDHYYLQPPQAVISGIPFSTMGPELGRRVVEQIATALSPGGYFVAYQIRDHVAGLGRSVFGGVEVWREVRNIPPARIFRFQK